MDKLKELSVDKELVDLVFRERLYEMDRKSELNQVKKDGKAEGKEIEKIETVKRLLQAGRGIEIIVEATGLSKEEIEKIKLENNKKNT